MKAKEVKAPPMLKFTGNYWELFLWVWLHTLLNTVAAMCLFVPMLFTMPYSYWCFAKWIAKNTEVVTTK